MLGAHTHAHAQTHLYAHGFWVGMGWMLLFMGGYCFEVDMDGHSFQVGTNPMPINTA
jgi:hypothetical protein